MRKLLNGSKVPEIKGTVETNFTTHCPDKWVHIDCEEGHIYVPSLKRLGHFKAANLNQLKSALIAIQKEIKFQKESV